MSRKPLQAVEAAECMRRGEVIAYPTEAVYGLGCDPANEQAVQRILSLKSRPVSVGLILIGASFGQFDGWVGSVPEDKLEPALKSWPGPQTWLFPPGKNAPPWITGEHPSVAVRVSAHPTCRALCEAFGGPVVSTSANPHNQEPALSADQVEAYFGSRIAGIVVGELGGRARCSGINEVLTGRVIREG